MKIVYTFFIKLPLIALVANASRPQKSAMRSTGGHMATGDNIRRHRKAKGLTWAQLANAVGLT